MGAGITRSFTAGGNPHKVRMKRPKILALTSRLPYPIVSGGQARMYHLLRQMAKDFDVDLLAIHEGEVPQKSVVHLHSFLRQTHFYSMPRSLSLLKAIWYAITAGKPLQIGYYYCESARRWLKHNYRTYDLVFCFHIRTAEYVFDLQCTKIVDLVDAISMGYTRAIKSGLSVLWNLVYRFELPRLLKYEREVISAFDKSLVVSGIDKGFLVSHDALAERIVVVPHGTEVCENVPVRRGDIEDIDVVFHGKMDYPPNEAACEYYVHEILPFLVENGKSPTFCIVGFAPTRKIQRLSNGTTIVVTGYVLDLRTYLERARVIVAPMTYGAGIKTKVLEAMGMGKAVVTTTVGADGISGQNGIHFFVADDPKEFAGRIKELLADANLRHEMGHAAHKLIMEKYTWEMAGRSLREVLHAAVDSE